MNHPRKSRSISKLVGAILFAGLPVAGAYAQVVTAENLLVNLDAATFNAGDTTWANSGTLGTLFGATGSTPTRLNINSAPGIFFDDSDFFLGPNSTPGIDGVNQSVSIEVWTQQGFVRQEEVMVSFGKRGGGDGTNNTFNYGTDARWGAVGHWGGADIGWGPNDPNGFDGVALGTPSTGQWHHLAYTYDGTTQKIFKDGVLVNQEAVSLNVHQNLPIQIAAAREADGTTVTGALRLGGTIGKVRIHDGVLTDSQVTQNFDAEKTGFGYNASNTYVKTGSALPTGPAHRYNFNNLASGADGTVITDSAGVGGNQANGIVRGAGANPAGTTGLDLNDATNTSSATASYVDLPNGIISGTFNGGTAYTSASYEVWVTIQSNQNWSRIMDFGSSNNAEVAGPGGAGNGTNYMFISGNNGTADVLHIDRGGDAGIGGAPVGGGSRETQGNNGLGTEIHLVMTYSAVDQEWDFFRNGVVMEGFSSNGGPGTINDVNNWLGRSQWGGDANIDAIYDEFRIYDYALTPDQVQGNFAVGPDIVNVVPEPTSGALLALGALAAATARRRRKP